MRSGLGGIAAGKMVKKGLLGNKKPTKPKDGDAQSKQSKQPGRLFDHTDIKEKVRQSLEGKTYDVANFYHKKGVWQWLARHPVLENVTLSVVALNTLWMGIDADFNSPDAVGGAHPVFKFAENAFCAFFFFEWFVRFRAFKKKRDGLRDGWFVFDTVLVSLMVFETWLVGPFMSSGSGGSMGALPRMARLLRLTRLTRVARMARLFRAVPELLILVKGMMAAVRSVGTTLLLLVLLLYAFALCFRLLTSGNAVLQSLYFGSIGSSMYTLLLDGIFMDNLGTTVTNVSQQSVVAAVLFWAFVLISSLTVMNMLIGVICEAVSSVAAAEKELVTANFVKQRLYMLFNEFDALSDGRISREEFMVILQNPTGIKVLEDVGLDVIALVDHADAMFVTDSMDGGERTLEFPEFVELVLSMRDSCTATVGDCLELRKFMRTMISQTSAQLQRIEDRLERDSTRLIELNQRVSQLEAGGPHPATPRTVAAASTTTGQLHLP